MTARLIRTLHRTGRRIARDRRGATIIEFAIVAPVFFVFLFGLMDIGQIIYGKAVLTGAVNRAARSSALETRNTSEADAMVLNRVRDVLPGITKANMTTSRTSYSDYADVGRPEKWNDANGNNVCDNNESFIDENRSGQWEADVGRKGDEGSASDVVVYSVTIKYDPVFKVPFLPERWRERSISARTVIKNQPFGNQRESGSAAGSCA